MLGGPIDVSGWVQEITGALAQRERKRSAGSICSD
jgi:hypothetical protein